MRKVILIVFVSVIVVSFGCLPKRNAGKSKKESDKEEIEETVNVDEKKPEGEKPSSDSEWKTAGKDEVKETPVEDEKSEEKKSEEKLKNIHFDFDSARLKDKARDILMKNAQWMEKHPNKAIVIEGHCDERGTKEYNLALGEKRAESTKQYLISLGISPERLKTISYGEELPVAQGHNEEAWSKNRRCHFLIKD